MEKSNHISSNFKKFLIDFNEYARQNIYDPVYYRNTEIKRIIETLCRRTKNNVILLGFPGVGKTSIIEAIAQLIIENKVPSPLKDKRIYGVKMSTMLAGTSYRGEFEERAEQLLQEICNVKSILFIDEFHTIMKAGSTEGSIDFVNILKPYIARGNVQLIGATTFTEYANSIYLDKALDRRFHKVSINEPPEHITYLIIKKLKSRYEDFYKVIINNDAILEAIRLTKNDANSYFPDKAIDLIDLACSSLVMKNEFKYSDELIELEYKEDFYMNLIEDSLFKSIFQPSEIIDINAIKKAKQTITQKLEIDRKKFEEQKSKLRLVKSYFKEATAMYKQGYETKSKEIHEFILPSIKNDLHENKTELTKDFINSFYNKNYGRIYL